MITIATCSGGVTIVISVGAVGHAIVGSCSGVAVAISVGG